MKIKLLQDWKFWKEGETLEMHPTDGEALIKEKIGRKPGIIKQIKNKIDGNDGEN